MLVISYQVTDGGPLDADGMVNGVIVDPAGPGASVSHAVLAGAGGNSTGAPGTGYGSPAHANQVVKIFITGALVSAGAGLLLLYRQKKTRASLNS